MSQLIKFILPAVMAVAAAATLAQAQTVPAPDRARHRPSAETMQRFQDGRIAGAVAALKMNDAQLKLWAPVEAQIRANQTDRLKAMEARADRSNGAAPQPSLPDRLAMSSERMAQRAEKTKAFAAVVSPFYAALSDAQKAVAGPILADLGGSGRGHHAMHKGGHTRQQ